MKIYTTLKRQYDDAGHFTGCRRVVLGWVIDEAGQFYLTSRVIRLHGERVARRLVREYLEDRAAA